MFRSTPLTDHHDLDGFDSTELELDNWLRLHARDAGRRGTARTFVWVDDQERVVGYYAVAAHKIVNEGLPRKIARGSPTEIPVVLLAKLALHRDQHGRGLGAAQLADALDRIIEATRVVAARYVVVDALNDEAANFYAHHGFTSIPNSNRLVRRTTDIAASLHRGARSP